jgi:hypothetical protein
MPNYFIPDDYVDALKLIVEAIKLKTNRNVTTEDALKGAILDYVSDVFSETVGTNNGIPYMSYATAEERSKSNILSKLVINLADATNYTGYVK